MADLLGERSRKTKESSIRIVSNRGFKDQAKSAEAKNCHNQQSCRFGFVQHTPSKTPCF
jgi:hypothetical protein